jgi:anti-sigma B factor antagonist
MTNLQIEKKETSSGIVLKCSGRLDANRSGHLNDYIDRLVREGQYFITLNLNGIEYLSSAGIRALVTQYKNLKAVNGFFHIQTMSENVSQVLDMVGMMEMLTQVPKIPASVEEENVLPTQLNDYGFRFQISELSPEGKTTAYFYGKPELMLNSEFEPGNARTVKSAKNHFALGVGAIGDSFSECQGLFGEYLMLDKNVACLPADGSKKPDYMVSSGQLVASLTELYGIHFEGNFSHLMRFDQENLQNTIGLSDLVKTICKLTNYKQLGVIFLAESGGLIGTSLNVPPVGGKDIFSFPEIKNNVNFTTEPAHAKKLTLSVGCFSDSTKTESKFLRPLKPDSSVWGHIHSAVFPYIALKKTEINLDETINYLFNNSEPTDVLHLINDSREITGLGESQFVQGFCWIVPFESNEIISTR